jgi:iron complex outermembrane receptor protein
MASAASLATLVASTAYAQTPPKKPPVSAAAVNAAANAANEEGAEVEAVVVTGTFLRGTPETATIPVEGYNLEQMRNQGTPSSLDFVKNLSEVGQVFGESNRASTLGNGQQTINLRSIGASRTVVVFNGRRLNEEYSFGLGRSNNIATIPQCAIGRVEVLKDGGGTTYGADAVGGVVNYITRRNVTGVEVQATYRYINGSSGGDYNACVTMGKAVDKGNIQASIGYIHRSILPVRERDFAFVDYLTNPGSYLGVNNPGTYLFATQASAAAPNSFLQTITPGGSGLLQYQPSNDLQFGTNGGFRDPDCARLGGFAGWSGAGTGGAAPACYTANGYFQNLVEESNIFQGYVEGNWQFSNKFKVHGEYSFYWLDLPNIPLDVFTAQPQAWPYARDKFGRLITGSPPAVPFYPGSLVNTSTPVFLAPSYNPAVQAFVQTLKNSNGSSILSTAQLAAWTNPSYASTAAIALPVTTWKPFGLGGGALDGDNDDQDNRSVQHRGTIEFSGDIGKFAGGAWDWDLAVTHGWGNYFLTAPDILVDRLQDALNGYGGPDCPGAPGSAANPVTGTNAAPVPAIQPGTNGCKFFNPFPSAYPKSLANGAASPTYNPALANDRKMVEWLYTEVETNYPGTFDVIDFVIRSDFDYHLWSEDGIQFAAGLQYRERHGITQTRDIGDERINPCATLGDPRTVCSAAVNGPLLYRRHFNISGTSQDYDRRYPVESAFAEIKVPITSKLNTQFSTRWEKYFSDLGGEDHAVMVSGGGIRYQLNDKIAFRATGQQSFSQANPLAPVPDVATNNQNVPGTYGGAQGANYVTLNVANQGVRPERGFNYNVGGVFQIGSDVTATVDYYNISIGQVIDPGGLSATTVLSAATVPGTTGVGALLNCQHPVVNQPVPELGGRAFFQLPAGYTCVQGVTTVSDALFGIQTQDPNRVDLGTTQVSFFGAQGQERRTYNGGSLDTSGIDVNIRWRHSDIWGGDLSVTGDLTYILTYNVGAFQILNFPYSKPYDGIGYVNNGNDRPGGQRIYPWRGSITANFRKGKHNFNWSTRAVSAITNNDVSLIGGSTFPSAARNANIGDINGNTVSSTNCPQQAFVSPPIPPNAGTGIYGQRNVIGSTAGNQVVVGYNPCQNVIVSNGDKLKAQFSSAFTYRVTLPHAVDFTLTIDNVFNTAPSPSRDGLNYDSSSSASPLLRSYQVGLRKTF